MSGSMYGSPTFSPESLQMLAFRAGHIPGNNLLHEFVLDHSNPDHPCSKYSRAYIDCILQSMYDAPVNELNYEEYSPLHLASLKNNVLMIQDLLLCLHNRINVNINAELWGSPLCIAAKNGHDEVVKELLKAPRILVNEEARNGHDKVVEELLKAQGILVNEKVKYYGTPLHLAARKGHDKVVKELLKAPGILVNEKNKGGNTPLHSAAENGHDKVVKELLKAPGILVNEKCKYGEMPLHSAASFGHDKVVKELLKAPGILVNEKDRYENTPLHLAAKNYRDKVVKELVKVSGILVNENDKYGDTSLLLKARSGHDEVVKQLLRAPGILVNEKDECGNTPLHLAARNGHDKMVDELLKAPGILVNEKDKYDITPLHLAAEKGHDEVVKQLLRVPLSLIQTLIPIYAGAIKPLVWTHADTSSHIFGKDGYGEFAFDGEILGKVDYSKPASVAMVELSKTHATDLNILVLGPTTNVALAGALDREFFNRVKHIYVMGSSVAGVGNVRPGVEFNFAADPEANYILLNSTISSKLTLFPWETAVNSGYTNVRVISLESFNFYILKFEFLTKILLIR
ncbi:hypothetical protein U1Q18_044660 [Sarracenia purpurea var. burkii]